MPTPSDDPTRDASQLMRLLALFAHDLRNPLSPLTSAAELLRRAEMTPARTESMSGMLTRQVGQLSQLIEELQQWAVFDHTAQSVPAAERVDLAALAAQAVNDARAAIESRGAALSVGSDGVPVIVSGAPSLLLKAMVCLLKQSARYARQGTQVHVNVAADRGEAVVTVIDDGEAIDTALLAHAFDLMADDARPAARRPGKLQIGMALANTIARQQHASLHASAGPDGRGAQVQWRMPLADH